MNLHPVYSAEPAPPPSSVFLTKVFSWWLHLLLAGYELLHLELLPSQLLPYALPISSSPRAASQEPEAAPISAPPPTMLLPPPTLVEMTLQMVCQYAGSADHPGCRQESHSWGVGPEQRASLLSNSPLREKEDMDAAFSHPL